MIISAGSAIGICPRLSIPSCEGEENRIDAVAEPTPLDGASDIIEINRFQFGSQAGGRCALAIDDIHIIAVAHQGNQFFDGRHPPVVPPTYACCIVLGAGDSLEFHGSVGGAIADSYGFEITNLCGREVLITANGMVAIIGPVRGSIGPGTRRGLAPHEVVSIKIVGRWRGCGNSRTKIVWRPGRGHGRIIPIIIQIVVFVAKIRIMVFADDQGKAAQRNGLPGEGAVDQLHGGNVEGAHLSALGAEIGTNNASVGLVLRRVEKGDDDTLLLLGDIITVLRGGNGQVANLSRRRFVPKVRDRYIVEIAIQYFRVGRGTDLPCRSGAILKIAHAGRQYDTHEVRQPGAAGKIELGGCPNAGCYGKIIIPKRCKGGILSIVRASYSFGNGLCVRTEYGGPGG